MIYLDHNATTPLDPRVAAAMEPYLTGLWGNPSSVHSAGREARKAVEQAREEVAALMGARDSNEIVFTSGGTESDALALFQLRSRGPSARLTTSNVEHPAVAECARQLSREGFCHSVASVGVGGGLDPEAVREVAPPGTALVSVMAANNEYGGVFPISEISAVAHASGAIMHSDGVSALGKMPMDVARLGVDLLSISAHKIYGPKGSGALYVRKGLDLAPLFPGGGQERRRRGGTENVAGIVGFGEAARLIRSELTASAPAIRAIRDRFEREVTSFWEGARVWGAGTERLPNTSSMYLPGAAGESLLIALDLAGIAVSVGSACSSGTTNPSPAILALGATASEARSTLRFSFGNGNREEELPAVLAALADARRRVRA